MPPPYLPLPPLAPDHACRNVRKGNSDAKPLIGKGATHDPLASRRCGTASLVAVPAPWRRRVGVRRAHAGMARRDPPRPHGLHRGIRTGGRHRRSRLRIPAARHVRSLVGAARPGAHQRRLRRVGVHLSDAVACLHRSIGVAVDADGEHRAVPARACPEGHGRIVGLERARRVPQPGARGGRGRLPAPDRDDRAGADRVVRAGSGRRAARGSVPRPVVRARPHDCLSRRRSPDNIRAVSIRLVVLLTLGALAGCRTSTAAPTSGGPPPPPPPPGAPPVHVQGTRLVDSAGRPIRLRGVNRSGTEYACAQGWGMFDGPSDSASVQAIASWKANVVRVPLNETCWLGINGVAPAYSGANYQRAIADYVTRLNRAGLAVILDLHWSADTGKALGQAPMPNRDHTPEFWRQVAAAYKGNDRVIFDLFNEPFPDNNADTPEAWRCWRDGGTCSGMTFQAAGMQELVDAVRGTGATNVIIVGGVQYTATLSSWVASKPTDPLNNLAASWHVYNFSWCHTQACWDSQAAPAAQQAPLVLGELGQDDGGSAFVSSLMDWMDARQGSYLAWVWDVWGQKLDLITSYNGTPTPYGQTFKTRFGS